MITGVNKVFEHGGRSLHIQAEDLGLTTACFEVRVYDKGTVLWNKRIPYQEILDRKLERLDQDDALRALMEKTLHTVQAAIVKGKIG